MVVRWIKESLPQASTQARPFDLDEELPSQGGFQISKGDHLTIERVCATEQDICSLTYGLKGKLDATVEVSMSSAGGGSKRSFIVPLELKTGKRSQYNINDHNAQVGPCSFT